jgi:hypothetical protein
MGVQYSLWGGSILNLGTERHRKAYFDDIDKFRLPGKVANGVSLRAIFSRRAFTALLLIAVADIMQA